MELQQVAGLPAHPLLVHIPVVLVPLAGVIAIVLAFKPQWLDRLGWWLVGLTGVGMIGAILAAGSGEGLEELQGSVDSAAERAAREDHFELGEMARTVSIVFFIVVLVVSAGAATWTMAAAGHQGATLAWCEEVHSCPE